jgi:hypothetical protein
MCVCTLFQFCRFCCPPNPSALSYAVGLLYLKLGRIVSRFMEFLDCFVSVCGREGSDKSSHYMAVCRSTHSHVGTLCHLIAFFQLLLLEDLEDTHLGSLTSPVEHQ